MPAFRSLKQLLTTSRSKNARRSARFSFKLAVRFEPLESRTMLAGDLALDLYSAAANDWGAAGEPQQSAAVASASRAASVLTSELAADVAASLQASSLEPGSDSPVIYVDLDATGANDGTSWSDAFTVLEDAIVAAANSAGPDEIWIAEGVYIPNGNNARFSSFFLPDQVFVFGGFAGDADEPALRDVDAYPTSLSGDLGVAGATFDNSYNVVRLNVGTAALSGLTVQDGNGDFFLFENRSGAGIRAGFGTELTLQDVVVQNNSASVGAGIFSDINATLNLAGVTVANNSANSGGGALFDNSTVHMSETSFTNNSANSGGGALFDNSTVHMSETSFTNNSASFGGGFYSFFSTLSMEDSTVTENQAFSRGGGVYSVVSDVALANTIVADNTASSSGGGVYGTSSTLEFRDTDILYNVSGSTGGGVLASSGSMLFDGGEVIGNISSDNGGGLYPFNAISTISNAVFRGNSAGFWGGGLQVRGGSTTVENSLFTENTTVRNGGGINVDGANTSASISGVTVENNTARNGGGVANTGSLMSLSDSRVANNHAKFGGGIIHQFSSLTVNNVAVEGNTAEENAGGLLNFRGQVTIESSDFDSNQALGLNSEGFAFIVGRGGAIENVAGFVQVTDSIFHRNHATREGGAIINNGFDSVLLISDTRVSQNTAGENGGGIFNEGFLLSERVHFAHNQAEQFGGAIYVSSGFVDVLDSRLTGNKAGSKLGTAIYVSLAGNLSVDDLTVISKNGVPVYFES